MIHGRSANLWTLYIVSKNQSMLIGDTEPEGKAGPSSVFASCSSDEAFKNRAGGGGEGIAVSQCFH